MRKYILILMLLLILPMVTSSQQSLGYFKQGDCINLIQTCSSCTYENISSVLFPNSSTALSGVEMTRNGVQYNYTFCNTTTLGKYLTNGYDVLGSWSYDFTVNETGRSSPEGIVLLFFIIGFLAILAVMVFIAIYSIGHFIKKDFDLIDLGFNLGFYFVLFGFYLFEIFYLGSPLMNSILLPVVILGSGINIVGGFTFFFISYFRKTMNQFGEDISNG